MLSDGRIHFQKQVNTRKARAVLGTPEIHRNKDGRHTMRRSFEYLDENNIEFSCPDKDCKITLTPNIENLVRAVSLLVSLDVEEIYKRGIFLDQRGGAVIDLLPQ